MAKKKKKVSKKSSSGKVSNKVSGKGSGKRGRPKKSVKLPAKKKPSKRGRKPNTSNRYNSIKSAISSYYQNQVGRKIKRYELKVIYDWVKSNYSNQSLRYVIMNIDVILDNFWQEYCNLYPVDLNNHARYFDWFLLKNYLNDEVEYHYPSDIIQVDLTVINEGIFEFFMEDYVSKAEEYYQICKMAGVKQVDSDKLPKIFLEDAYCDVQRKGNVYKYKLIIPDENDDIPPAPPSPPSTPTPPSTPEVPEVPVPAPTPEKPSGIPDAQVQIEIEKERLRKEYELKQQKLEQLQQLLRDKVITFQEYLEAISKL